MLKAMIFQNQSTEDMLKVMVFLSSARTFGDKYGKKVMDTATKAGIDAAKTASKRVVQKLQKLQET